MSATNRIPITWKFAWVRDDSPPDIGWNKPDAIPDTLLSDSPSAYWAGGVANCTAWAYGAIAVESRLWTAHLSIYAIAKRVSVSINEVTILDSNAPQFPLTINLAENLRPGENAIAICIEGAHQNRFGFLDAPVLAINASAPGDIYIQPDIRRRRMTITAPKDSEAAGYTVEGIGVAIDAAPGKTLIELPQYETWPDRSEPYILRTAHARGSETATPFAMREVTIRENKLFLNGRPVQVRATRYDPAIVATSSGTPIDAATDLRHASDAGFNMVVVRAGSLSPRLLDAACDRGMMVAVTFCATDTREAIGEIMHHYRNAVSVVAWIAPLYSLGDTTIQHGHDAADRLSYMSAIDPSTLAVALEAPGHALMRRPYRDAMEPCRWYSIESMHDAEQTGGTLADVRQEDVPFLITAPSIPSRSDASPAETGDTDAKHALEDGPANWNEAIDSQAAAHAASILRTARINPTSMGYVAGSLRDTAIASDGFIGCDGKPKASIASAKLAQAERTLVVRAEHSVITPREDLPLTVHLLDDIRAESQAEISLQVVGPTNQVLWKKKRAVRIGRSRKPIWEGGVAGSGKSGDHRFVVRLIVAGRVIAQADYQFTVIDAPDQSATRVKLIDPAGRYRPSVSKLVKVADDAWEIIVTPPVANTIRAYPGDAMADVFANVHDGAGAIVFAPPTDWNELADRVDPGIRLERTSLGDWPHGCHGLVRLHPVFEGLPSRCLIQRAHVPIASESIFTGRSDESILPYALVGDDGQTIAGHGIAVRRYGSGRITFVAAPLIELIEDDVSARLLFSNLVHHTARRSVPPQSPPAGVPQVATWITEQAEAIERWRLWIDDSDRKSKDGTIPAPRFESEDERGRYDGPYTYHRRDNDSFIAIDEILRASSYIGKRVILEASVTLDRRTAATIHLAYREVIGVWVNGRASTGGDDTNAFAAPLNAGRNRICIALAPVPPDTKVELTLTGENGKPIEGLRWR